MVSYVNVRCSSDRPVKMCDVIDVCCPLPLMANICKGLVGHSRTRLSPWCQRKRKEDRWRWHGGPPRSPLLTSQHRWQWPLLATIDRPLKWSSKLAECLLALRRAVVRQVQVSKSGTQVLGSGEIVIWRDPVASVCAVSWIHLSVTRRRFHIHTGYTL